MLSTFVIGLREGLEAALIVGIVAAFLKQRGRYDLLRLVWLGVGLAALICLAVGLGLHAYSAELPQKQQEGLETVVGAVAVAMVTYMVIWMRRHSRELKKQLEGAAGSALESGSGWALVLMAFLAVFREGFETAVFLLAAFNEAANPVTAGAGAVLGLLVALVLGYAIFRGGVRINLSKFFRATGAVLVLVAAGLVVNALHTAHEAGWLLFGQGPTINLSWLVRPGSVQSSLLTGMLGWQPRPVVIELAGWLLYLIPVGLYVVWPPGRAPSRAVVLRTASVVAVAGVAAGTLLLVLAPSSVSTPSSAVLVTSANNAASVRQVSRDDSRLVVATSGALPTRTWTLRPSGNTKVDGRSARIYDVAGVTLADPAGLPSRASIVTLATLAGGRLPLGISAASEPPTVPVRYATTGRLTASVDTATGRLLNVAFTRATAAEATLSDGPTSIGNVQPVAISASRAAVAQAAANAGAQARKVHARSSWIDLAVMAWVVAAIAAVVAASTVWRRRSIVATAVAAGTPVAAPTTPHPPRTPRETARA
jgi:high-affinity iron transporter